MWIAFLWSLVAGYNYFGNERLYSGTDGRELDADIFVGIVYYQRLRHMVADKFQVPFKQYTFFLCEWLSSMANQLCYFFK